MAGFDCTVLAYREWLTAELEALGEPVDLVGHDVGASTVVSVAMARPRLLRTWASDSLGVFDPGYAWHDLARTWQTPGAGEKSVADLMGGSLNERIDRMAATGTGRPVAAELAAAQGQTWAGPSSPSTALPPSRPWLNWAGTFPRHSAPASLSSGPRSTLWARRRCRQRDRVGAPQAPPEIW
ncbi:MAG: hypothetical protein WAK82_32515 [Streptosporangiaceae bacterium]